jgi:hypothetical protein
MTRGSPGRLAVAILVASFLAAPSCSLLKDYEGAAEGVAAPAIGAGLGASVAGPVGAVIGGAVGAGIEYFRQLVKHQAQEIDDLRRGKTYGHEVAHELGGSEPVASIVPWYLRPWTIARIVGGWLLLVAVVFVLSWRFGHPLLEKLKAFVTLGIAPAVGKLREITVERRTGP